MKVSGQRKFQHFTQRERTPGNFDRSLGGPQSPAGRYREETKLAAVENQMPIPFNITSVCQVSFSYK